jgi:hypothetical protein
MCSFSFCQRERERERKKESPGEAVMSPSSLKEVTCPVPVY